jgi:ABC-type amino acid transport substrate-binding protein
MRRSENFNRFVVQSYLIFIVLLCNCIPAFAQSEATNSEIKSSKAKAERIAQSSVWRIGVKEAPPFSYKDSNGQWVGISLRLWQWVAQDIGLTYRYEEHDLQGLLDGVSRGDLDVGVGALTITAEREKLFDFSHSFFSTGLGVAVKKVSSTGFVSTLRHIMKGEGLRTMGVILLSLALITVLIFFCERRYAKDKPDKAHESRSSLWSSLWWSLVILIGKNDRHPASLGGRILALSWMVFSLIIFASLTALITSALTVTELQVQIHSPNDLVRARLVTVRSSASEEFLHRERINFRSVATITDAFRLLAEDKTDAIVYDKPILRYLVKKSYPNEFEVPGFTFETQKYAFAIKEGKQELEDINRSLLSRIQGSTWGELIYYHLGE